jgi:hypothetical protein
VLVGLLLGCQREAQTAGGSPIMESVELVDPEGMVIALDTDAGPLTVSPLVQFVVSFDRLLDPRLLEELVDGQPVGRMGVARLEGPGMPRANIQYQPNGDGQFRLIFPGGPRLLVQAAPTLPSGSSVSLIFEAANLRGKDGSPVVRGPGVPQTLTVTTLPFTARIRSATAEPSAPVDAGDPESLTPSTPILVQFSNLPHPETSAHITVSATDAAGVPLPAGAQVQADPATPTGYIVTPPAAGWPAGSSLSLQVAAGAKDALGIPLAAAESARFQVAL